MVHLRAVLLAAVTAVGLDAAALAADLPTKMPIKAPPLVGYVWDGFYIGGYYGTALGSQTGGTPDFGVAGSHTGQTNINQYGATFGVTAGYNWQFAPHWLVGLEGEFGYLNIKRSEVEFNDNTQIGLKTDWYGTARARFGYVTGPSLLYATGGGAFVHSRDEFGGNLSTQFSTQSSKTTASWTAGYGVETKLSRAWSAKTEYLFIDGGNNDFIANPRGVTGVPSTFDHGYHLVKTGLNYKFGEPESFFAFFGAPPIPSDHNWQGFYVGVNVGGGQSLVHTTQTGSFPGNTDVNGTGFAGGGQIGYNLTGVLSPKLFVGVEGDIGALRIHAMMNDWFDAEAQFTANTRWYATARGRFGVNTGPALIYFTAGGAWVHLSDGFTPITSAPNAQLSPTLQAAGRSAVVPKSRSTRTGRRVWSCCTWMLVTRPSSLLRTDRHFGAEFRNRFQVVRAGLNYKIW